MLPPAILVIRNPAIFPCFVYGTARACIRKRFRFRVFASMDALSTIHSVSETCSTFTLLAASVFGTFAIFFRGGATGLDSGGAATSERGFSMAGAVLNAESKFLRMMTAAPWASK
jgi:hypothetical protein